MQIEFETAEASVSAPEVVSSGAGPSRWPMLSFVLVVGVLAAGLVWLGSDNDPSTTRDEPSGDEPPADAGEIIEVTEDDEPTDDRASGGESVIPESSSAVIAVEAARMENARRSAFAFDGGLLSLDEPGRSSERTAPPIARSTNGESWEIVDTEAFAAGVPNNVEYSWIDAQSIGGGVAAFALNLDERPDIFLSDDAIVWDRLPVEEILADGEFHFEPLAITDNSIVGARVGGSRVLTQLLVDHTTFSTVQEACFADRDAVFSCDGETEWQVDEATINSELGTEAVRACFEQLAFAGPEIRLSAIDRSTLETIGTDERIFPGPSIPVALSNGRIAGIETPSPLFDGSACDGVVSLDEVTSGFSVFDPADGATQWFAVDPRFGDQDTEVLGEIALPHSGGVLVRSAGRFWIADMSLSRWWMLDIDVSGEQFALSDSGERVYGMDGADLLVLDLVEVDGQPEFVETRVFVASPSSVAPFFDDSPVIQAATDELVTINFETGYWLVNVPSGLRCAEQYAAALGGNGLVEGC